LNFKVHATFFSRLPNSITNLGVYGARNSELGCKSYELFHFIAKMMNFSSFTVTFSYMPCGCLILPGIDMGTKKFRRSAMEQARRTGFCEQEHCSMTGDKVFTTGLGIEVLSLGLKVFPGLEQWLRHFRDTADFGSCSYSPAVTTASTDHPPTLHAFFPSRST
jgi:hypothetical protein